MWECEIGTSHAKTAMSALLHHVVSFTGIRASLKDKSSSFSKNKKPKMANSQLKGTSRKRNPSVFPKQDSETPAAPGASKQLSIPGLALPSVITGPKGQLPIM